MRRFALSCFIVLALTSISFFPPSTAAQTGRVCFTDVPRITNCIEGRFREFWEQNGGLLVFGYPITAATNERNRDTGQTYLTQWFERARFELHPGNPRPYDVLLGRLGEDRLLQKDANWKAQDREPGPKEGCLWFEETGRNVCDAIEGLGFKTYWMTHGLKDPALSTHGRSLALLGLPLTSAETQATSGSGAIVTQWFERGRLEYDPRRPEETRILPGLLGNEIKTEGSPDPPATPTQAAP